MLYTAFQLTIKSDIDIPEMLPGHQDSEVDLVIKKGKTPEKLQAVRETGIADSFG